jgi:hypothetical protein
VFLLGLLDAVGDIGHQHGGPFWDGLAYYTDFRLDCLRTVLRPRYVVISAPISAMLSAVVRGANGYDSYQLRL